ncbi:hypothetical protein JCGZ_23814 [Jatropha curcas]|uniref:WW domain-containing protein n=1 Tax=Jatropha curcas TaxID=180498 RepID=A0A067L382_JATCU|nr:uncharacterized protein LOC105629293 [Jatropha curcas]KDP42872.1 hypothetical protein JCGZ_23814 [Jatropha curcas]
MGLTELSLAPTRVSNSSSSESENNVSSSSSSSKKRKFLSEHHLLKSSNNNGMPFPIQTSVDLHVKDPLPLDWEQCLDLETGRVYYLNRKTLKRSWDWPKDQKVDLELNISPFSNQHLTILEGSKKKNGQKSQSRTNNNNMVALACLNCHLLVILSRTSPSCPNCKYVHSLPSTHQAPQPKISPSSTTKSLDTLSLLN